MTIDIDAYAWMRTQEKKAMHAARRGQIRTATDILGPGFGPRAVETTDWNSDECSFNGFFWSAPGAANAPATAYWTGLTISNGDETGYQEVRHTLGAPIRPGKWVRTFSQGTGGVRAYSAWKPEAYQTGVASVSFTADNAFTQVVTFPIPFFSVPTVSATVNSGAGVTARFFARAYGASTTGFTLYLGSGDGSLQTWAGVSVTWLAICG